MTYAAESERPETEWRKRAADGATSPGSATFIAIADDTWVGMAAGRLKDGGDAEVIAMWVAPEARSRGIGGTLVGAVANWARELGGESLELWVTDGNGPARNLYERQGFFGTGEHIPLASSPGFTEERMTRSLLEGPQGAREPGRSPGT